MSDLGSAFVLDTTSVIAHLQRRGLLDGGDDVEVSELSGGVSGVVLAVRSQTVRWVVKQSLLQLLTEREWRCDQRRIVVEGRALGLGHRLTPDNVPDLIDLDETDLVLVMTAAGAERRDWKSVLLDGEAPARADIVRTARELGAVLGCWHRRTADELRLDGSELHLFADRLVFEQLRVTPFHRAVRATHPDLGHAIDRCIDDLFAPGICLVHGDFSPKNVLVGDGPAWVVDFEVAHVGQPVFDLAFLTSHLLLKAIHRPALAAPLAEAWRQFMAEYHDVARTAVPERLAWHVACLALARVDGISPATYLTATDRDTVIRLSAGVLSADPIDMTTVWARAVGASR